MIQAIGAIGHDYDSEYIRIIRELQKYGITPTGNKQIDKARLRQIKQKEEQAEEFLLDKIIYEEDDEISNNRRQLEELRTGAMTLAQINRVLLGI